MSDTPTAQDLAEAIDSLNNGLFLVLTGAGISTASGIPSFRGDDNKAVWKENPMELGTVSFFRKDPVRQWDWYLSRFQQYIGAQPNPAHFALADLERWCNKKDKDWLLVTQNIDTLHEDAGSEDYVKVHGTMDRYRCSGDHCRWGAPRGSISIADVDLTAFRLSPSYEHLPRCKECESILRPHVLWFDEYYMSHQDYSMQRLMHEAQNLALVLFIGTSFSVGITAMAMEACNDQGVPMLSINPAVPNAKVGGIQNIARKAEDVLPEVCEILGIQQTAYERFVKKQNRPDRRIPRSR
jgi:NAD-dependent deacetylase